MVELKAIDKKIKAYIIDRKEIRESTGSHDISSDGADVLSGEGEDDNIVGYNASLHQDSTEGDEHKKTKTEKSSKKVIKSKEKDQNLNDLVTGGADSEISEKI